MVFFAQTRKNGNPTEVRLPLSVVAPYVHGTRSTLVAPRRIPLVASDYPFL